MKPKVSIIVPVYNTKDTLRQCVVSLLNQTLRDIEIILVDDGSPDGSGKICDLFLYDERVKVIHKENGGLSSARNSGLEMATGEYIGFVDSDDYVSEEMYEILYTRIKEDQSDICMCSHFTVDSKNKCVAHYFSNLPSKMGRKEIRNYLLLPLIGTDAKINDKEIEGFVCRNLYKRKMIIQHFFKSEREYFAEDVVSDLEIYSNCDAISVVNKCLYYYRYNGKSLSNRYRPNIYVLLNNLLEFEESFLKKNGLVEQGLSRLYSTGVKFVIFSIQNIKKGELTYREQVNEVGRVLSQPMLSESIAN